MGQNEILQAIEDVIDKRAARGASDISIIAWLNHLKTVYRNSPELRMCLDGFIDAIHQTPLNDDKPDSEE